MRKWWLLAALAVLVAGAGVGAALRFEETVPASHEAAAHRAGNVGQATAAREAGSVSPAEETERQQQARRQRRSSRFTLRPAPTDHPVPVGFASHTRAGILFGVHN